MTTNYNAMAGGGWDRRATRAGEMHIEDHPLTNTSVLANPQNALAISAGVPAAASGTRPSPAASSLAKGTPGTPKRRPAPAQSYPTGQPLPPLPAPRQNTRPSTAELTPGRHAEQAPTGPTHGEYGTDYGRNIAHEAERGATDSDDAAAYLDQVLAVHRHANSGCSLCRAWIRGLHSGMATQRLAQAEEARQVASADAALTTRRFAEQRVTQAQDQRRAEQIAALQAEAREITALEAQAKALPAGAAARRLELDAANRRRELAVKLADLQRRLVTVEGAVRVP